MKLKDKTYRKFINYFEKMSEKNNYEEFEVAYSEIQRETGVASITLKKAIRVLEEDGIIKVNQGRNTRYGRFQYLIDKKGFSANSKVPFESGQNENVVTEEMRNISNQIEQLRQRVRTQEMTISVILDRLAELEDRIH
ncbi:MAG: hypothetical protein GX351_01365 [Peptococcaceae bacterium]|nr:hypothetical protein [Peptococcaceae bacterium]